MNKILTFVVDTAEADLSDVVNATVKDLQDSGHTVKEVRVADDSGEQKMTVPEPPPAEPPTGGRPTEEETPEEDADEPAESTE